MDPLLDILSKGGGTAVLAVFALLLWRRMEKRDGEQREDDKERDKAILDELAQQTALHTKTYERIVRIDERLYHAAGGRGRLSTPVPGVPITPAKEPKR